MWESILGLGIVTVLVGWRVWADVRRRQRGGADPESLGAAARARYYRDQD
jgi:hypothetical protein